MSTKAERFEIINKFIVVLMAVDDTIKCFNNAISAVENESNASSNVDIGMTLSKIKMFMKSSSLTSSI
jgi:predicted secreted acid phosphatase